MINETENTRLREALPGIQQSVGEVESAIAYVKSKRKIVSTRKEENLKELDDNICTLHAALDRRKKELKENIIKTSQAKDENLQVLEGELCTLLSQLKSFHSLIEDEVQRRINQDVFVMKMKRSMLKERDRFNTEVKNKIKLCAVEQCPLPIRLKDMDEVISQLTE